MKRHSFSMDPGRLSMWLGGAALAFGIFVRITRELMEGEVGDIDSTILHAVATRRTPWLTIVALDVTALGSISLVVLFSVFTFALLLVLRDRLSALQLFVASAGAGVLTFVTKNIIERTRPEEAQQMIAVSTFSYPSGHSVSISALYLTIAIIMARHVRYSGARTAVFVSVAALLVLVGISRVYLGVHYPTDVVSGVSLGAAWALLVAGFFALGGRHRGS